MGFGSYDRSAREAAVGAQVAIFLVFIGIVPVGWFFWHLITPEAKVERFRVVSTDPDGCRAEVWVNGAAGDRLMRLMQQKTGRFQNRRPPTFVKAVISHENMTSIRLPERVRTPAGECEIVRWHLLIGGVETDSVRK